MLNYRDFRCCCFDLIQVGPTLLQTIDSRETRSFITRFTSHLSICQFSHALVVADWRPQVTLHVHLPLMVIFRDGETGYQHSEPKVTVTRHDGCLLAQCLLSRSQGAYPGTSPPSNCVGISLELYLTSQLRVEGPEQMMEQSHTILIFLYAIICDWGARLCLATLG